MPRVNIHEVDNTKPGTRAYQNFTVVVPGFHAPYCSRDMQLPDREAIDGIVLDKESIDPVTGVKSYPALTDQEVFGDEGILEIKTQADFEQYIGFVKPQAYNEGFKAAAITRTINSEDVYGDPENITYYNGSPTVGSIFSAEERFIVEQDKAEKTMTFVFRYDDVQIPNPDASNYDPKADKCFSSKFDNEERITYKYDVNGFDVTLYKKPIVEKVGQPPFSKVSVDANGTTINKDNTGALCNSKGQLFNVTELENVYEAVQDKSGKVTIVAIDSTIYEIERNDDGTVKLVELKDAEGNIYYQEERDAAGNIIYTEEEKSVDEETGEEIVVKPAEIVYKTDSQGNKIPYTTCIFVKDAEGKCVPSYLKAEAADYDFENPVPSYEAFVLFNDEQKIHKAGCCFEKVLDHYPTNTKASDGKTDIYANSDYKYDFPDDYEELVYKCAADFDMDTEQGEAAAAEVVNKQYVRAFQWCPEIRLPAHYGNQIAYELLGLGYTVYYVNMGEWYPTKQEAGQYVKDELTGYYERDEEGNYIINEDPDDIGLANIDKAYKALGTEDFWANLRDKTTYDFRFVLTGFIEEGNFTAGGYRDYMKNANFEISKLAAWEAPGEDAFAHVRARGDCLALIDLDEDNIAYHFASTASGQGNTTKRLVKAIQQDIRRQNFGIYGKYSAIFTPSVTYANNLKQDVYQNCKFPASFHYLACFAKSVFADNFKEWFAVAGFTRGLSTYNIDSVGFKLGDVAMNALEPRFFVNGSPVNVAVNVIVNNRGSYYIWGNRTCHTLGEELTASHFLNIRQLCITLKKYIYVLCRKFTFDPNSDVLWANFVNGLTPTLENMKANQGIRDYAIEKVPTDLKGVLAAKVRIVPIEAVEDFEITVSLEDSLEATVGE